MSPKLLCREMAGRRALATWSLSALALLLAAPVAGAAWTAPINLSAAGQSASQPQVALDETGDAVFAWQLEGPDRVAQTRARSSIGALSPIQNLSLYGGEPGAVSSQPDVAVDDSGGAVLAWRQFTQAGRSAPRVQARARSAAGALSPIRDLSPILTKVEDVRVAVDSDGDAVFVWQAYNGANQIQARTRTAAGVLGPLLELTLPTQTAINPQVGVDDDGDAIFTWQRLEGTSYRIETRALSATGDLGPTEQVSSSRWTSVTPQLAVSPAGAAVYVWKSSDPDDGGSRIEMRARLASGTLIRRQTVSDAFAGEFQPRVAITADGAALFAWRLSNGTKDWLNVRPRSALGGLGDEQTVKVADSPQTLSPPRVAMDADGDAVIAWELFDATGTLPPCCDRVQARTRSSTGTLGSVQTLSPAGQSVSGTEVSSDPDGDAVVAWSRSNGSVNRIQAAAGP
jgi:hypothetical protein